MGGFVSMTAVRRDDLDAVVDALTRYGAAHAVPARAVDPPTGDPPHTAYVWAPTGGWTVVSWPGYFTGGTAAGRWLSDDADALVSSMEGHDGDFWMHVLWRGGLEVDRFASFPDYFTDDRAEGRRLAREWAGDPDAVAAAVGVPTEQVAPYLLHPHSAGFFGRLLARRRPFPDDSHVLGDFWVFTDFWRRMGITYPADDTAPVRAVTYADSQALPSGGPSL
jgi:hypothetical protein